jgi:hypothetical protein
MPWVRLDEGFPQHPKVIEAGPLALAMQVAGLCYANRYLTDGFMPRAAVATLMDFSELDEHAFNGKGGTCWIVVARLVELGIWEEVGNGYQIHDYLDYQPSKAQVEADRAVKVAAGQAGGQASAQARAQAKAKQNASRGATESQAKSKPVPDPVPDPVPLIEELPNGSSKKLTRGEFQNVTLSADELKKLQERFGERDAASWIEELSTAKASKGYKSKSDYATILSWSRRREDTTPLPPKATANGGNGHGQAAGRPQTAHGGYTDAERSAAIGAPLR